MYNCKNPYQGKAKKVLCVCSAGLLRSPTAAVLLAKEYGYNTRSAGIDSGHALIPVDNVLIHWADEIVCMNEQQAYLIKCDIKHGDLQDKPIIVLNVPDNFGYMDPKLQELILASYKEKTENGVHN
jgi:predicted protein tyrosine phosphatase